MGETLPAPGGVWQSSGPSGLRTGTNTLLVDIDQRADNQVQVQPTFQPLVDAELRRYVRRELAWNPYIRRNAVHVEVSDGVALLSGTVLDRRACQEAERSAREVGAHRVVNRLEVLEGPAFLAPDVVGAVDARPFPGKCPSREIDSGGK